jgi:hypothetical protein
VLILPCEMSSFMMAHDPTWMEKLAGRGREVHEERCSEIGLLTRRHNGATNFEQLTVSRNSRQ